MSGKMNHQDAKNAKFSFYNLFSSRTWRLGGEKLAPADFSPPGILADDANLRYEPCTV
jgi:hypothetical protein